MTKPLFADDLAQADTLHREALAKIVYDMAYWLKRQRAKFKTESARLRKSKKLAEARASSETADVYDECFQHLRQLRSQYGEHSARQSFFHYAHEEGAQQVLTDPTPEEIAEMTAKIREGWTDSVYQMRASLKTVEADTPVVKCDRWLR
jgi:hypothetical protein